jgi:hypothetical protein
MGLHGIAADDQAAVGQSTVMIPPPSEKFPSPIPEKFIKFIKFKLFARYLK